MAGNDFQKNPSGPKTGSGGKGNDFQKNPQGPPMGGSSASRSPKPGVEQAAKPDPDIPVPAGGRMPFKGPSAYSKEPGMSGRMAETPLNGKDTTALPYKNLK